MRARVHFGARLLLAAYLCDLLVGDPPSLPHPVRAIGTLTTWVERRLRGTVARDPRVDAAAGALLWIAVTGTAWIASSATLRIARRCGARTEFFVALWLAQTTLATRTLLDEARAVEWELERGNLSSARSRLARIVGRDTNDLAESEIARAAIETLAESLCDGIVAPLCALTIAGVPGAMAFKAISTLDSMIGHIEPPYTFFGRTAAHADDAANYLPARLTALLIAAAASSCGTSGGALRTWFRDGNLHASPNAGQCEAAMAGALGVRLGGSNRYGGIAYETPSLGAELATPATADIRVARRLVFVASLTGAALAVAARALVI
jgi:adenosylcobinamide-phosphate synthase